MVQRIKATRILRDSSLIKGVRELLYSIDISLIILNYYHFRDEQQWQDTS